MTLNQKVSLAVARKIAGMTQKQLAAALGVTESTLLRWEKGRGEPSIGQALQISELVGIPLDSIIFLTPTTV